VSGADSFRRHCCSRCNCRSTSAQGHDSFLDGPSSPTPAGGRTPLRVLYAKCLPGVPSMFRRSAGANIRRLVVRRCDCRFVNQRGGTGTNTHRSGV